MRRELQYLVLNDFILSEVLLPSLHTIRWLFVLESSEDSLVFSRYFHQTLLSCITIKTRHLKSFYEVISTRCPYLDCIVWVFNLA